MGWEQARSVLTENNHQENKSQDNNCSDDNFQNDQVYRPMVNTKNKWIRLLLAAMALVLTPAGARVLSGAFGDLTQPHIFVMLVFSGSLTLLLGLVGLVGFVASFASKGASADKTSDDKS